MRTSAQRNLTRTTLTSRHAFNCCAVGKVAVAWQLRLVLLYPRMFILKPIKQLERLVHQDLNGAIPLLLHLLVLLLAHLQLDGEDLLRLIHHLSLQILMINESRHVAQFHHLHVVQVQGRMFLK